jgi:WbqC-like protein family
VCQLGGILLRSYEGRLTIITIHVRALWNSSQPRTCMGERPPGRDAAVHLSRIWATPVARGGGRFIVYDDVAFLKNVWINRNRIAGPLGPEYLTNPLRIAPRAAAKRSSACRHQLPAVVTPRISTLPTATGQS